MLSIDEIKPLVECTETPCVSLYMPTYQAGTEVQQNSIRFKNVIKQAEALLIDHYKLRPTDALGFLQPVLDLDRDEFWQHQNQGLAAFIAQGVLQYYRLPLDFDEMAVVSDRFYLKPLLPLLNEDGHFYVLALSQKQLRLFEGTRYSMTEIELDDLPQDLDSALQYDPTAKAGQFRVNTNRGGTNNSFQRSGSYHGQGSPDQDQPQVDILQFFHLVDKGLQSHLKRPQTPLLLAGVEYLLPLYQEANTYPELVDTILPIENVAVLDPETLRDRAWATVEPHYAQVQQSAAEHYRELAGTGRTSTNLKETVAAAYYGRIDQLFVAADAQEWGRFDPQANELKLHQDAEPGDEDLLNAAAMQTLLNGGKVYVVNPEEVPEQASLAAVFRY